MAQGTWRLTVRQGSDVVKLKFDSLDQTLSAAHERVQRARREGNLPAINALRDFEPGQRVHARIELSGPGLLRAPSGGIDVMGDGGIVAYSGAVRKQPLGADSLDDAIDQLRAALIA